MKRLTERRKKWLLKRSRHEARKRATFRLRGTRKRLREFHSSTVQIWQGGEPEWAICTSKPTPAPQTLSFRQFPEETTDFFCRTRNTLVLRKLRKGTKFVRRRTPRSVPKINGYLDFSRLKSISTASAVVLTADYHRIAQLVGEVPPTIDLHKWDPHVVTRLYQIGFFSLLGHIPNIEAKLIEDGPTMTMPILCATKADGLQQVDEALQELGNFVSQSDASDPTDVSIAVSDETIVQILTTISEAITNVTQHAYPDDHDYEFQHIGSFWVAATAHRENKSLTVVVYDQGASIPITYPRLKRVERVMRFLRRTTSRRPEFEYEHDGTYIRASMRYGGSRTDKPYRGKGFPQMFEILQSLGAGRMSIRSRGGWCHREPNGRMQSGFLHDSIGGTLIEWKIDLNKPPVEIKQ